MKSKHNAYNSTIDNDKIIFTRNTSGEITSILFGLGAIALAIYFTKETAKTISTVIFLVICLVALMSSRPFQAEVDSAALKIKYKLYPYKLFPGFIRTRVFPKDILVSITAEPKVTKVLSDKSFTAQVKVLTNRKKNYTVFSFEEATIEAAKHESEALAAIIGNKLGISVQSVPQDVSALTSGSS